MQQGQRGEGLISMRAIAHGGMGELYEAENVRLGRRVAVKVVRAALLGRKGLLERFLQEAEMAARVEHPNVVRVYGVHEQDGQYAIEMELIEGSDLRQLMQSGPVAPVLAARLLADILSGLEACHEAGVVHCDLKPGNVLIDRRGMAHLADFGIARVLGAPDAASETESGVVWGTPPYLPPEASLGTAPTPAWDLYATGVMMREVLGGTRQLREEAPALPPGLSAPFAALVDALSAASPADRPPSAAAALKRLKQTAEFRTEEADTGPTPMASLAARALPEHSLSSGETVLPLKSRSTAWRWAAAAAVSLTLLLLLAGVFVYPREWPEQEPDASQVAPPAQGAASVPEYKRREARFLTYAMGEFYFSFDDGIHGRELWSLGGYGGAELVADLNPGPKSSDPTSLVSPIWGLFFAAKTEAHGVEPWTCTGSWEGKFTVTALGDLNPGPMGSTPRAFHVRDNLVLFYACTHDKGWEPWVTLGGASHTALLEDLYLGIQHSMPMDPRFYSNADGAYMLAIRDARRGMTLYRYAQEANLLEPVTGVSPDSVLLGILGSRLLFSNEDPEHGHELWVHDALNGECRLLIDIAPGASSSNPDESFLFGGRMLFQASTPAYGKELWITDGTREGTLMVADLSPGPRDGAPFGYAACGDAAYFRADTEDTGRELWCTDGTPSGTRIVADIWPGGSSSHPYNLSAYQGTLYFSANDGVHGEELWYARQLDGQFEAALVSDLWPGETGSEPRDLKWAPEGHGAFIADLAPGRPGIVRMQLVGDGVDLLPIALFQRSHKLAEGDQ